MNNRKIIVAITGASGSIYALKLLERLRGLAAPLPGTDREAGEPGLLHHTDKVSGEQRQQHHSGMASGEHGLQHHTGMASDEHSLQREAGGSPLRNKDSAVLLQEVAVILTSNAAGIMVHETGQGYISSGVERQWQNNDFNAPFASGSSSYDTMIICPASMGMVGRIAHGVSDDLITRAADVMLKERRRLILVPRETPYSLIHINNMKLLTEAGAIICPATPSFYSRTQTIDELVMTVTDRVLALAGFTIDTFRWNEEDKE